MKNLDKMYSKLTTEERLRAFIEAAARRDADEADRLNDTCPRHVYETEDQAYIRAKFNVLILTYTTHLDAARHAELAVFAMAILMFGQPEHHEKVERSLNAFIRRYRTKQEGFARFCATLGIDPETLRSAMGCQVGPMTTRALEITEGCEEAEPSEEQIAAEAEVLIEYWRMEGVI